MRGARSARRGATRAVLMVILAAASSSIAAAQRAGICGRAPALSVSGEWGRGSTTASRATPAFAAAVAIPLCRDDTRTAALLDARIEALTRYRTNPTAAGALAAFSSATRLGEISLGYQLAAIPAEEGSAAPSVGGDTARLLLGGNAPLPRATAERWTIGIARRSGALGFALVAGSSRGVVRATATTTRGVRRDSVWTDTSGWVPVEIPDGTTRPVTRATAARWATGELRLWWARERVGIALGAGGRLPTRAVRSGGWGTLEIATRLLPNVWVVAGATSGRGALDGRAGGARSASVGVRLTGGVGVRRPEAVRPASANGAARLFSVTPLGKGMYTVAVTAPGARAVELSADFTGWTPVALARRPGGVWVADLPVAPGTHRVNLRIDGGAWEPPPGTVMVDDDFGGAAGMVVIPER